MTETSQQTENPLLKRARLPGESFTLPSGGLFYKDGELDDGVQNAEVHVYPMTALDEILIKTPDKLFSGDAIREVFERCVPQITKPGRLLARDVDFVLIALRKVSYGEEMEIHYTHDCKDAKDHSYVVNVSDFLRKSKRIDPTTLGKEFVVELSNDQKVHIQPIRFDDMIAMMQINEDQDEISAENVKTTLLDGLANVITQIDEVTKPEWIREALDVFAPMHLQEINEGVDRSVKWGPDFKSQIKCRDCGKDVEATIPLNPLAFFT